MIKGLGKTILLIGIVSILSLLLFFSVPRNENHYYAALIDKHELLRASQAPRILLIGGSNLPFGLDSELLEKNLNRAVINTGLHAGLGYEFCIDDIARFMKSGDIIVVCPEYRNFFKASSFDDGDVYNGMYYFFNETPFKSISSKVWSAVMVVLERNRSNINLFLQGQTKVNNPDFYTRDGFNNKGDLISHLGKVHEGKISGLPLNRFTNQKIDPAFTVITEDFIDLCTIKNVSFLFSFPSISETIWDSDVVQRSEAAAKQIPKLNVISKPTDYLYPEEYFFNTHYHLNAAGRQKRTEQLSSDILEFLKSK